MTYKKAKKPSKHDQDASYLTLLESLVEMRIDNMKRVQKLFLGELALLEKAEEDLRNYKTQKEIAKKGKEVTK